MTDPDDPPAYDDAPRVPPLSPVFADRLGYEWSMILTIDVMRRVKDDIGVNLADEFKSPSALRSFCDRVGEQPLWVADVLAAVLSDQAAAAGVTADDIVRRFDAATYLRAVRALLAAVADFGLLSRTAVGDRRRLAEAFAEFDAHVDAMSERRFRTAMADLRAARQTAEADPTP